MSSTCRRQQSRNLRRPRPNSSSEKMPIAHRLNVPQVISHAHRIHAANADSPLPVELGEAVIIAIMNQFQGEEVTEPDMMAAYKVVVRTMFPGATS